MSEPFSALRVLLTRTMDESEHLVDAVVLDENGPVLMFGNSERPVIARSSLKPIQVVPVVSSGAADAFSFDDQDIALGAASHSGDPRHLARTNAILKRIGLDESALECGPARTIGEAEADQVVRAGDTFRPIHNCCSGKHAGFLAIAQHLGIDPAGYIQPDHPVQRLVTKSVETFTGADLSEQKSGADGCGIPTHAIPLRQLAAGMVRLSRPDGADGIDDETAAAAQRVVQALAPNPFWMSGDGRAEVDLHARVTEPLVAKVGAEGVFMATLPNRGVGIALKARDGARRAADLAMESLLEQLGVLPPLANASTQSGAPTPGQPVRDLTNAQGNVIGVMNVSWS